jgi:putative ATP-dependent endonuclease of the OLD family
MHLATVDIVNFRSLRELHVDFQPGLNVLVGRNNTGKTNLMHAIRHALGPASSRGDALWLERDDFFKESVKDDAERTISITLSFAGLSEAQRSYFYEIVSFDLSNLENSRAIVRFEATWPSAKRQASIRRAGGPASPEAPEIPSKLLEALPVTFLPALRDAEASLAPGHRSRLALLLRDVALRQGGTAKSDIEAIYARANDELEQHSLISDTRDSLQITTRGLAGSDYSTSVINTVEVEFERILRSLRVLMDGSPIGGLDANGLGYNNLLYMAVVLEHLKSAEADETPLLLIEEPEAHLHPQLTTLLADYLATNTPGGSTPQTIVTTHSPTLAASVPPSRVHVLFSDRSCSGLRCHGLATAGMTDAEQNELQRMMDITRATLYFAKAAILVEGISESLLLPVLARRMGYDLAKLHVSIIPICGVAFETFRKVLDPKVLGIPVAIVTDGDPPVSGDVSWKDAMPELAGGTFKVSDRTTKLLSAFAGIGSVRVFHSRVTLEYDLAEAADENALLMADVWESCFTGVPGTFNRKQVLEAGTDRAGRALRTWRGICRSSHSGSKAEFAHRLAAHLSARSDTGQFAVSTFGMPEYLEQAIRFVAQEPVAGSSSSLMSATVASPGEVAGV